MARRGRANAAESLVDEVADLGPSEPATFSDPIRAETPERDAPAEPETPPQPDAPDEGEESRGFDARRELGTLRQAMEFQQRRSDLLERELLLARGGHPAGVPGAPPAAAAAAGQAAVDPVLQEGLDILNVTEDDLVAVFSGGEQGAQLVSRALQTVYLLAVNAAERRLMSWYGQDQGRRSTEVEVATRAQAMHTAFWTNYPELQDHEILVQHFAAQVAREQEQSPRFDWDSAQREVASRTINHLRRQYNVTLEQAGAPAAPPARTGYAPTLQSRMRPVVGEMGGGRARGGTPSAQTQLTNEILDLGR